MAILNNCVTRSTDLWSTRRNPAASFTIRSTTNVSNGTTASCHIGTSYRKRVDYVHLFFPTTSSNVNQIRSSPISKNCYQQAVVVHIKQIHVYLKRANVVIQSNQASTDTKPHSNNNNNKGVVPLFRCYYSRAHLRTKYLNASGGYVKHQELFNSGTRISLLNIFLTCST